MLEHIFRNINDIRIFDLMTDFVLDKYEIEELDKILDHERTLTRNDVNTVNIDEVIELLDYNEYKRVEVQDSLDHLARQKILGIRKIRMDGTAGCIVCKYSDKFGYTRPYEHRDHIAEQTNIEFVDNYYMEDNRLTGLLRNAIFNHVLITVGDENRGEYDEWWTKRRF